jgi:pimeloyl-ACP methyl ester carboxylesterase
MWGFETPPPKEQLSLFMRSRMETTCRACAGLAITLCLVGWAWTDEPGRETSTPNVLSRLGEKISFPRPSLDGAIAWTDQYFFHQWRIQEHVESHKCRLLDEDWKQHATGTFDECLAELESIKRQQDLQPMQGKAVVLLHGLGAPCWSMHLLARYLHKHGGYQGFSVDYASLRSDIDYQGKSLANVINSLRGIEEINLVGHSMGNIVIRRYMAGHDDPVHGWRPDPRIARIVMIAPPNHGSIAATRLSDYRLFKTVFGASGLQLGVEWEDLKDRLATPHVEFGIIAGGYGNEIGLNPFIPGDDDGRIRVETTRLAGAADFLVVPAVHEFIANHPRVFQHTLRFLTSGYFVSPEQKQSIPREPIAERARPHTR